MTWPSPNRDQAQMGTKHDPHISTDLFRLETDPRLVIRGTCWGSILAACLLIRMLYRNPTQPTSQTQRPMGAGRVMQVSDMGWGRAFCGQPDSRVLAWGWPLLSARTNVSQTVYKSCVARPTQVFKGHGTSISCCQVIQKFLNIVQARSGRQTVGR